jgi:hypothetical protein
MNKNIIRKVTMIDLSDETNLLQVDSLEELKAIRKPTELIYETPRDFFILRDDEGCAYRVIKQPPQPIILKVSELSISPDSTHISVKLSISDLFQFAVRSSVIIFETSDKLFALGEPLLYADKERKAITVDVKPQLEGKI